MQSSDQKTPGHPRACGERTRSDGAGLITGGSSPRLRGTVHVGRLHGGVGRVIPAPAGNGPPAGEASGIRAGHPRACGERFASLYTYSNSDGSSPRLRGTGCRAGRRERGHRVIPAPAGNGPSFLISSFRFPGHPRACGERSNEKVRGGTFTGSSPRLRGTADILSLFVPETRVIPAPAGNGNRNIRREPHLAGHPRACGERREVNAPLVKLYGSSPRLRGTARTTGCRF
ncbi:hypothetical protein SAMN05444515_101344 [Ectothiorhodospira marina]|uniref:Uncharacterized protein n=1 Tax=Ectothiorhodospira marina TaxID=1396821 RepID=A0A1H7FUQ1_9GAMM|nr:hypothetical protein SAMN05444515_101344 [Ectothiorhodospira marina]